MKRPTAVETSHQSPRLRTAVLQANTPVVPIRQQSTAVRPMRRSTRCGVTTGRSCLLQQLGGGIWGRCFAPDPRRRVGRVLDSKPLPATWWLLPVPQRVPSRNTSLYLDTRFRAGGPPSCRQLLPRSKYGDRAIRPLTHSSNLPTGITSSSWRRRVQSVTS